MNRIHVCPLPVGALLAHYRDNGAYTDGFCIDLPCHVTLSDFIMAFYTTPLFRLERLILATLVGKPSTDAQILSLASADATRFAAWTVEGREHDQILLCDFLRYSRSWLMCTPAPEPKATRLYFGSAIVPRKISATGKASFDPGFHLLKGFHLVYSRALLAQAAAGVRRGRLRS